MKKYVVYDNDKPAIHIESGCNNNVFNTFEEAVYYASRWIYLMPSDGDFPFKLNIPYDYSGYGDYVVIKEKEVEE